MADPDPDQPMSPPDSPPPDPDVQIVEEDPDVQILEDLDNEIVILSGDGLIQRGPTHKLQPQPNAPRIEIEGPEVLIVSDTYPKLPDLRRPNEPIPGMPTPQVMTPTTNPGGARPRKTLEKHIEEAIQSVNGCLSKITTLRETLKRVEADFLELACDLRTQHTQCKRQKQ